MRLVRPLLRDRWGKIRATKIDDSEFVVDRDQVMDIDVAVRDSGLVQPIHERPQPRRVESRVRYRDLLTLSYEDKERVVRHGCSDGGNGVGAYTGLRRKERGQRLVFHGSEST